MESQVKLEIVETFAQALRQSDVVQNYLTARAEMEGDSRYAQIMQQIESQTPANNLDALRMMWQTVENEPPLQAYLRAKIELVTFLRELNEQISSGIGFNIAASLQPASSCG